MPRVSAAQTFAASGVEVTLQLEYRLNRRSPVTPAIDLLFIRRATAVSLGRTLARFGTRLRTSPRR